ncbi:MAG: glycosyltransferase family 4 protein [Balneolaceae bacterium]
MQRPRNLLLLSTPVAPLGSGIGGGVEYTVAALSRLLISRNYYVEVAAPQGSRLPAVHLTEIFGVLQPTAQHQSRTARAFTPQNGILSNMCRYLVERQEEADLIINFAYDWTPLYMTPQLDTPMGHFITMSSLNDAMDYEITQLAKRTPGRLACYTRTQAETFPQPESLIPLGCGINTAHYTFCAEPDSYIVWIGRISKEKGLADAVELADRTGIQLRILGKLEEPDYWNEINRQFPDAPIRYEGFLGREKLQASIRKAKALLMTPRWIEAFGIVALEALACGVPVISYQRGGPAEIIEDGKTGFLTCPDSVDGLIEAVEKLSQIDRRACRQVAEGEYSLHSWGDRFEKWCKEMYITSG